MVELLTATELFCNRQELSSYNQGCRMACNGDLDQHLTSCNRILWRSIYRAGLDAQTVKDIKVLLEFSEHTERGVQ